MRQIVLDTETTGLSSDSGDRIVEIGCVELVNRKRTGHYLHCYINPERDMPEAAFKIHGLSTAFLSDKPTFAQVATKFLAYVQGADQIIIHNAIFDLGFLDAECRRIGLPLLREVVPDVLDTYAMAKELFPGKRNSLDALCDRLGVDNSGRDLHGALLDAELLADAYVYMTRGQDALLIDGDTRTSNPTHRAVSQGLVTLVLPVISANEAEQAAHLQVLADIDKASKGQTVWRRWENATATAS